MAFRNRCAYCTTLYDAERTTSRFCSDAHRTAYNRQAEAKRVAHLSDLLTQTAEAIRSGAPAGVLEALSGEAERLLGHRR